MIDLNARMPYWDVLTAQLAERGDGPVAGRRLTGQSVRGQINQVREIRPIPQLQVHREGVEEWTVLRMQSQNGTERR